jgi:adenylate kinase family enzyme
VTLFNLDSLYQKNFKLRTMNYWDSRQLNELLGEKVDYSVILGRSLSGKSTVCKMLKEHVGYHIFEMKQVEEELKKKLGTEEEPIDEVPYVEIEKEIIRTVMENKKNGLNKKYVFDGYSSKSAEHFNELLQELGPPDFFVRCGSDLSIIKQRYKLKNETDEVGEDAEDEMKQQEASYTESKLWFEQYYESLKGRVQMVDIDTSASLEATVDVVKGIFAPKIVLVNHEKNIQVDTQCANLAIKYNMMYISVYQLIKHNIDNQTPCG